MSLLLLFKPRATATTPEPETPAPAITNAGRHKPIPPPGLERFRAGTASIYLRATQPQLLLVSNFRSARFRFGSSTAALEQHLESQAAKQQLVYRAARDERDLDELVEAAYLLSR